MNNYFECTIKYEKTLENGVRKKISEKYLVDSISFTEAEKRIIEESKSFITGDFTVDAIKRYNITELFENTECEPSIWFRVKVNFITLDEKSGMEKKTANNMLVQASDIRGAQKYFDECMKNTMADYQVEKIVETKIMDVYKFETK